MNPRQRYIETLTFGTPDKVPLQPGWGRRPTLEAWHNQGLPRDKGLGGVQDYLWEILGIEKDIYTKQFASHGVDLLMYPQFEEKILEHKDGHYIVQDWKGNICEISDEFGVTDLRTAVDFVTRSWIKCPVENRDDWEQMKTRYNPDSPERFPADFDEHARILKDRDYIAGICFSGTFWQMREWLGFENLCMLLVEDPDWVAEMAEFHTNFILKMLEKIYEKFIPDEIMISEDMAYKAKSMISPGMARDICAPAWKSWARQAKQAGVPIVGLDSDGYIGELIPLWIEAGIDYTVPVEVAAHCNIAEFRSLYGHKMAYSGGIDKRCIAKGGQAIIDELKRIEPVLKDGGYLPCCDHAVPHDVSWPNYVEYTRLLAQMTGWL